MQPISMLSNGISQSLEGVRKTNSDILKTEAIGQVKSGTDQASKTSHATASIENVNVLETKSLPPNTTVINEILQPMKSERTTYSSSSRVSTNTKVRTNMRIKRVRQDMQTLQ